MVDLDKSKVTEIIRFTPGAYNLRTFLFIVYKASPPPSQPIVSEKVELFCIRKKIGDSPIRFWLSVIRKMLLSLMKSQIKQNLSCSLYTNAHF